MPNEPLHVIARRLAPQERQRWHLVKRYSVIVLIGLAVASCTSARVESISCGHLGLRDAGGTQIARRVELKPRFDQPGLYFISNGNAIFVKTDDVISLLESQVREPIHSHYGERLLVEIKAHPPTTDHIDLYRYSFEHDLDTPRPEFIVADLLQSGAASVIDLWNGGESLLFIDAVTLTGRGGEWREFCNPAGNLVLRVTDVIYD